MRNDFSLIQLGTTKNRRGMGLALIFILSLAVLQSGCAGLAGSQQPGGGPGPQSLTVSNASAGNVTTTSAAVSWQTNLPATSQIEFGTSTSYGSTTALDASLVVSHQQAMSGLNAATQYHFRVRSRDANNNEALSNDMTVTTSATPDTTAPTVSISSPAANATVSGTISVTATASDNVGVAGVQFKADGNNIGAEDASSPYSASLSTTTLSNGNHTLTAVARDAAGNTRTSAAVTMNVNNVSDTTAPTVSITTPASGANVSGTISISANASDNVVVAGVQFKLDGSNIGAEDTSSPYGASLNTTTVGNGNHTLTAVARDAAGNTTTSAAVTMNVNNVSDTTAPTVSITSPANGATVSGTISVTATASDNFGVAGVQFKVDGSNTGAEDTSSPYSYSLDTSALANGNRTLAAVARDAAGNQTTSASRTINVSNSSTPLPPGSGWAQLANTHLQSVCPPDSGGYAFSFCQNVIAAWSGGVADTKRNRLILWGGGHNDYYGNEVYALDLNTQKLTRLNNPSPPNAYQGSCIEALSDGKPNSRHTYGGLAYIAHADKMFVFGGSLACGSGSGGDDTWTLDLATLQWRRMDPVAGGQPVLYNLAAVSDYDPNTKLVFLHDRSDLWSYNYDTNTYAGLSSFGISVYSNAVIDPKRKLFLIIGRNDSGTGPSTIAVSIAPGSNYAKQDWTSQLSGCSGLASAAYPGLAYDSVQDRIVGWTNEGNGSTVYIFNPDTKSCTSQTFSGGPTPNSTTRGTFGRWRYFAALNVFVVINDWQSNAYTLRMTSGSGTPAPSGPAISGVTANSIGQTTATIVWVTDVGATSQVDYGTSTSYGSSSTLDSSMVTAHTKGLTGLTAGTTYHYRVRSRNSSSVETVSGDAVFATNNTSDTTAPSVSITSPASGATVSGSVTVSASASDNVGVAGVQFLLDGVATGSELTSAPFNYGWNTTTSANGSHTLTARARDAAGNNTTSTGVSVSVSNSTPPPSGNADADYAARCAAAGVIRCYGFDNQTDAAQYINLGGGQTPKLGSIDATVMASGAGSLRFMLPSQSGEGTAGSFPINFSSDLSQRFGEGDEFYIQWRQRMSPEFVSLHDNTGEGWKQVIISSGDTPGQIANACTDIEVVVQNTSQRGLPQMYHSCGNKDGEYQPLNVYNSPRAPGQYELQNGLNPPCLYTGGVASTYTEPPCFKYKSNQWLTFQVHVKIGTWYKNNGVYHHDSSVQMWIAEEGQPSKLVVDFSPGSDSNGYDLANMDPNDKYGKIWFTPYFTGKDPNQVNPISYTWYDEFIVSRNKIADPQ